MILLAQAFQTVSTFGGVSTITNALSVTSVEVNFSFQRLSAKIARGFVDSNGNFAATMDPLSVTVKADGSFSSTDGTWNGAAGSLPIATLLGELGSTFDNCILLSDVVQGTEAA
jgi:hypothetical protein